MKKVYERKIGNFKGTVYLYDIGYGYKIRYGKEIVNRSYYYSINKEDMINEMDQVLKSLSGYDKDLFDLERL